ncbi:beta-1,4-galactosyltransferase 4-like [Schistocerca americana]|uniref:beta-1,4-galactosyltransferase 4-like n=1 Tax=Schistocerca americana TaxID=7009 RepID=UPI001F4FB0CA|nr:beta-1,4-galactosyltransferase 4-like [Schistocerca americana]
MVVIAVVLIFCVIYLLHPGRFACYYSYINDDEIVSSLGISPAAVKVAEDYGMPLCSVTFNSSVTEVHYPIQNTDLNDGTVFAKTLNITDGGEWKPQKCVSKFSVAVVVPYRNRSSQLQIFLKYMHPFLQNQLLSYQIFVVEQALDGAFNRAKLLNVGFVEAMKIRPFHCFIFHDVDLIPQKDNNIYACTSQPRHMSSCVNTFRYHLPYEELFGGAVAILQNQFEVVNGFSNNFYGWECWRAPYGVGGRERATRNTCDPGRAGPTGRQRPPLGRLARGPPLPAGRLLLAAGGPPAPRMRTPGYLDTETLLAARYVIHSCRAAPRLGRLFAYSALARCRRAAPATMVPAHKHLFR